MTPFHDDEVAWDDLPVEERLRDCFAEAETAMEEAVALLRPGSDLATTALAELARHIQAVCGRVRSLLDDLCRTDDAEEA